MFDSESCYQAHLFFDAYISTIPLDNPPRFCYNVLTINSSELITQLEDSAMKSPNTAAKVKDIVVNAFFVFALVTIIGMVSNVLLLALGYIISTPMMQSGYTDAAVQVLWFTLASVSLLACVLAVFALTRTVGSSAAQFLIGYKLERKLNIPAMVASVLGGNLLHTTCCIAMSWSTLSYLIIAGPVQYIARFIGHGQMSIFNDIALDFSLEIVIGSIFIYSFFITAASFAGYIVGHAKKLAKTAENEQLEAKERMKVKNVRTPDDAGKTSAEYLRAEKPEIVRDKLDPKTERLLLQINHERVVKTAVFIMCYFAAVVAFWFYWTNHTGREPLSPYTAPFVALLILPFYPFRLHERFTRKSYYAVVTLIKAESVTATSTSYFRRSTKLVGIIQLRAADGESITLKYRNPDLPVYRKGEKVFKLSAFKYPVKCTYDDDDDVLCPNCGHTVKPGPMKCPRCRTKFARTR